MMTKFGLYTVSISPHLLPVYELFSKEVGGDFTYFYQSAKHDPERVKFGWDNSTTLKTSCIETVGMEDLFKVPVLIESMRNVGLIHRRLSTGLSTVYSGERWLKPPLGILRILKPSYFKMVRRFVSFFNYPQFKCLPIGIHAARDMLRLAGLFRGDLRCLFRAPRVAFESRPCGRVALLDDAISAGVLNESEIAFGRKYGFVQIPSRNWGKVRPSGMFERLGLWGYFVKPHDDDVDVLARKGANRNANAGRLRILWCGRIVGLKRIQDVLALARSGIGCLVDVFGEGPLREKYQKQSGDNVHWHDFITSDAVRREMQSHDLYVFSSNAYEGWGAVVSEALAEKLPVVSTLDGGAAATMLGVDCLYRSGDVRRLIELVRRGVQLCDDDEWHPQRAADALARFLMENRK